MTELEQLRQRRELVILAAELQRATVVRRLERIQANPAKRVLGIAANAVSRPLMIKLVRRGHVRSARISQEALHPKEEAETLSVNINERRTTCFTGQPFSSSSL